MSKSLPKCRNTKKCCRFCRADRKACRGSFALAHAGCTAACEPASRWNAERRRAAANEEADRARALRAAVSLPHKLIASPPKARHRGPTQTTLETSVVRLQLRHTWTTVMSTSTFRDVVQVRIHRDGLTGMGEGAPIPRYHETATSALQALETVRGFVEHADPMLHVPLLAEVGKRLPGEWAAKAALAGALADWIGKKLGCRCIALVSMAVRRRLPMSIGIDTPDMTRQKCRKPPIFRS